MTEIHASYKRIFQIRPYETETIELSVTDEVSLTPASPNASPSRNRPPTLAAMARDLHAALAKIGDEVLAERIAATR